MEEQTISVPVPAPSEPQLTGADWLAARRVELKQSMKQAQHDRRVAKQASKEKQSAGIRAAHAKRRAAGSPKPLTPEEQARQEHKEAKRKEKYRARQRRYQKRLRRRLRQTPEAIRARNARKMRTYRKTVAKRKRHERWLKKLETARLERQAKEERRSRREKIAAEKASVRAAQGFPEKKPTPTQQRIDAAFAEGFRQGVEAGRTMERAETQAA